APPADACGPGISSSERTARWSPRRPSWRPPVQTRRTDRTPAVPASGEICGPSARARGVYPWERHSCSFSEASVYKLFCHNQYKLTNAPSEPMNPKQRAAEAALQYVRSGTSIGLGTGSTADYFLVALGEALKSGRLQTVRGVPTSEQTQRRARALGIPTIELA